MALIGFFQAATAVVQNFQFDATLGMFYSLIEVAYAWFEGIGRGVKSNSPTGFRSRPTCHLPIPAEHLTPASLVE